MLIFSRPPTLYADTPSVSSDNVQTGSTDLNQETLEAEVMRLVNLERTGRGLTPLKLNQPLVDTARAHSQDMIDQKYFDHIALDGSTPWDRACRYGYTPYGWGGCFAGENLAAGFSTPAVVVKEWMKSPGHRALILDPVYREIGIGFGQGGEWGRYWTMRRGHAPVSYPSLLMTMPPLLKVPM